MGSSGALPRARPTLRHLLARARRRFLQIRSRPDWGPKVFCIGFNKTGTTSVGLALDQMGFRHSSFNVVVWRRYYQQGRIDKVLDYASRFDSHDDLPWLKEDLIPVLDRAFPGSKFIYLEREEQAWKASFARWTALRKGFAPDPERGWSDYQAHRRFVQGYFKGRVGTDLLNLCVNDAGAIDELAAFVGRTPPSGGMPHVNRS